MPHLCPHNVAPCAQWVLLLTGAQHAHMTPGSASALQAAPHCAAPPHGVGIGNKS